MTTAIVPASFQHVEKALQVGIDISVRMVDRMAHAGLGRKVNHRRKAMPCKQRRDFEAVRKIGLHKGKAAVLSQDLEPRPLQCGIIIAVEVVETDDGALFGQQLSRDVEADEARGARDQYCLIRHPVPEASFV